MFGSAVLSLAVVYLFRGVFAPLLVALAVAYVLEPLTVRLSVWMPRAAAVATVFVVIGAATVTVGTVLVLQLIGLGEQLSAGDGGLVAGVEALIELANQQLARLPEDVRSRLAELDAGDAWRHLIGELSSLVGGVLQTVIASVNTLGVIVLTPFYLFYLMLELPRIWQWTLDHLPVRDRVRTLDVLARSHRGMSAFLRGRVVLAVIRGVVTSVGLAFIGTPQWLAVGMASGMLTVLPFLGPVLGTFLAAALTLSEHGFVRCSLVVGLFIALEWIENVFLQPLVLRDDAELHPVTVLFSVVFWGAALGVFGALIAIPLTLMLKILVEAYLMPSVQQIAGHSRS